MATRAEPGAETAEAQFLRKNWSPERLGEFEGLWIAVQSGEIVMTSQSLEGALAETRHRDVLLAFVTFEPIQ